jgi:hypothetical protein
LKCKNVKVFFLKACRKKTHASWTKKKFIQRGGNIKVIAVNRSCIAYPQGLCLALCCLTKRLQIIFFIDALCNVRVRITSREVFILGGSLVVVSNVK